MERKELPAAAIRSMEVDVATLDGDENKSDLIDGNLGEGSQFHETYGFYAQGFSLKNAVLPAGWRARLVILESVRTRPGRGLCLEPHDCVSSSSWQGGRRIMNSQQRWSLPGSSIWTFWVSALSTWISTAQPARGSLYGSKVSNGRVEPRVHGTELRDRGGRIIERSERA